MYLIWRFKENRLQQFIEKQEQPFRFILWFYQIFKKNPWLKFTLDKVVKKWLRREYFLVNFAKSKLLKIFVQT